MYYFQCIRNGITKLGQLDRIRTNQISRIVRLKEFIPWIEQGFRLGVGAIAIDPETNSMIWKRDKLVGLSNLTCKELRETKEAKAPLTAYKIGLTLEVADSLTWCYRINKLTSTRHKAAILRSAHGDIYTKDRKLRFGLADNDSCERCGQPDSRLHAIATCPKAMALWNMLREIDNKENLTDQSPELLKEIFGASERIGGELAINAEIIQLLSNSSDNKLATIPTRVILRIILGKLYSLEKGQTKENVKTLLDRMGPDH